MIKECFNCKNQLEYECFYNLKSSVDGKDYTCKECVKIVSKWSETAQYEYRKAYYKLNKRPIQKINGYKLSVGYRYKLSHEM